METTSMVCTLQEGNVHIVRFVSFYARTYNKIVFYRTQRIYVWYPVLSTKFIVGNFALHTSFISLLILFFINFIWICCICVQHTHYRPRMCQFVSFLKLGFRRHRPLICALHAFYMFFVAHKQQYLFYWVLFSTRCWYYLFGFRFIYDTFIPFFSTYELMLIYLHVQNYQKNCRSSDFYALLILNSKFIFLSLRFR